MKNKSILALIALCAGLQTGIIFGQQAPQSWSDWAYSNYSYYVSPYVNRIQRVATAQLGALYQAAQKEGGALGKVLMDAAQKEVKQMMPKIQEALLKGDFEGAKAAAMDAGENFQKAAAKGWDDTAMTGQKELKNAANKAFSDMMKNTVKEIDASELASMKK